MPLNAIAGVLIGVANDWTGVLVAPFIWGAVWCLYVTARGWLSHYKANWNPGPHWRLGPTATFFLREYTTAALTALVFAVVSAGIKLLVT